jgi:hypothetical protein
VETALACHRAPACERQHDHGRHGVRLRRRLSLQSRLPRHVRGQSAPVFRKIERFERLV